MTDPGAQPHSDVATADDGGHVESFLAEVATRLHGAVPPACGAAVTLEGLPPRTAGASTEVAAQVDTVQYAVGVGPCLTTLATGAELYAPDLAEDPRWLDYGKRAAELGVRASFSVPVVVDSVTIAVTKLYAASVDPFAEDDFAAARDHAREMAGGLLLASRLLHETMTTSDLRAAMGTRRVIDLALGVLMERAGVGPDEAFALLTRASQDRNIKLNVLAAQLVESVAGAEHDARAPFTVRGATPRRRFR